MCATTGRSLVCDRVDNLYIFDWGGIGRNKRYQYLTHTLSRGFVYMHTQHI